MLHFLCILLRVTSGNEKKHIKYIVYEYEDLIDSSNMSTAKMLQIALDILQVCYDVKTLQITEGHTQFFAEILSFDGAETPNSI